MPRKKLHTANAGQQTKTREPALSNYRANKNKVTELGWL